jgi:hypothetical protein
MADTLPCGQERETGPQEHYKCCHHGAAFASLAACDLRRADDMLTQTDQIGLLLAGCAVSGISLACVLINAIAADKTVLATITLTAADCRTRAE